MILHNEFFFVHSDKKNNLQINKILGSLCRRWKCGNFKNFWKLKLSQCTTTWGTCSRCPSQRYYFFKLLMFNVVLKKKKTFKTFSEYGEYESDQPPMIVIDLSCVAHLGKTYALFTTKSNHCMYITNSAKGSLGLFTKSRFRCN